MKYLTLLFLSVAIFSCTEPKNAQDQASDQANIGNQIQNKDYTFRARSVSPTGGRTIQLTTNYDMRVSKDSLVTYLPYFGRAYSATPGTTNSGMDFTSTDFEHTFAPRKKGGWEIKIIPKDNQDIQQMFLTVFGNGSASLQITSNNRQPISYEGTIIKK
ncbi:MAG: DUF4251 domain-containing protein [Chitinophagaceae bacterium]|nr:DUF4251 domain-containing protein [Chitinophagaceae bacterium]